ncbi:MAG: metallophosphoesterase [Thiobacillus sp.]
MAKSNKILVISDTHLSKKFDQDKFDYLKKIIKECDKVIINGDFWDYYWFTDFDDFINSEWRQLFPILLEKEAVYVYGNHDPKDKCDDRVNLFSVLQTDRYDLNIGKSVYRFEHGNRLWQNQKNKSPILDIYTKIILFCEERDHRLLISFLTLLGRLGFMTFREKIIFSKSTKELNDKMKHTKRDGWLICGDSHRPEIDNDNMYANSGFISNGFASYLIISAEKVILKQEKY